MKILNVDSYPGSLNFDVSSELRDLGFSVVDAWPNAGNFGNGNDGVGVPRQAQKQVAWELAKALSDDNQSIILAPGLGVARGLAGNPSLVGRYLVVVESDEAARLGKNHLTRELVARALAGASLVIGSAESLKLLRTFTTGHLGSSLDWYRSSDHDSTGDLISSISLRDRLSLSLARHRVVFVGPRAQYCNVILKESADSSVVTSVTVESSHGEADQEQRHPAAPSVALKLPATGDLDTTSITRLEAWQLRGLSEGIGASALVISGSGLADYCVKNPHLSSFSWLWIDEENYADMLPSGPTALRRIRRSARLLVADSMMRNKLEAEFEEACGKVSVLSSGVARPSEQTPITTAPEEGPELLFRRYGLNVQAKQLTGLLPKLDGGSVLFAGHDFKFMGALVAALRLNGRYSIDFDRWRLQHLVDEQSSKTKLRDASVIWCEFATRNAVWYSNHKQSRQRLIVRMHGYEVQPPWTEGMQWEAVDQWIFVSEAQKETALQALPIPAERSAVVPNSIDTVDFRRPKITDSRFHLGLAGYVPGLKRPDRALDLLESLLESDSRYVLHLRGRSPSEYGWVWNDRDQRLGYDAFFERLAASPFLRSAVSFDGFGMDMANWFRKVGWILSPSDHESFHLAPVEGMASGAIPVVWNRRGAPEIFPEEAIVQDTQMAVNLILSVNADPEEFRARSADSISFSNRYDNGTVLPTLMSTLHGKPIP